MCANFTCAFTYKLIFTYDLRPAFFIARRCFCIDLVYKIRTLISDLFPRDYRERGCGEEFQLPFWKRRNEDEDPQRR